MSGVLLTNKAARFSTMPDASFVSWESLTSGRVTYTKGKGRPKEHVEMVGQSRLGLGDR